MLRVWHAVLSVHCSIVVICWKRAGLLVLLYDVFLYFVTFPCDVLDQISYLIVSIPDLCLLPYFNMGTNKLKKGEKGEQRRDHLDVSSAIGDQI